MNNIHLVIDDKQITTEAGRTILEVCLENGVNIPALCAHPTIKPPENCGICVVELEGLEALVKSCATFAENGMRIHTESVKVVASRVEALEKILKTHPNDCLGCVKTGGNCLLQEISYLYGVNPPERKDMKRGVDCSSPAIVRNLDKCIACGRCVAVCEEIQKIGVYEFVDTGDDRYVNTINGLPLSETGCINCGQCVKLCPVGALSEKDEVHKTAEALRDPARKVIFQMAPAIHNTAGEEFGLPGMDVTKKLPTALRKLGATVFTTDYTADVTILEEGTEFIGRVTNNGVLPMFTSCCPGWIKFIETNYPQLLGNLSSCKSPQQMFGALLKSYYAEKENIDPADIFHVSIMPCVAKKYERQRPEMKNHENHLPDVDAVLTTRELAKLLRWFNIDMASLHDSGFDPMMGEGTGAARIFAASGGVMEAALRTVVMKLTGDKMDTIDFTAVRDTKDMKEAELDIGGMKVRVAVVNGIGNARGVLDDARAGRSPYHFVEFMACPGGCVGGGGSPVKGENDTRKESVYRSDANNPVRRSHENREVIKLYKDYLGKPCGDKSHHLLHTSYFDRSGEDHRPKESLNRRES